MQQDDGGSFATHFVPRRQARHLDIASLEAFEGRHFALGHRSLLPDEDRERGWGPPTQAVLLDADGWPGGGGDQPPAEPKWPRMR